jgi:hypothetical protein
MRTVQKNVSMRKPKRLVVDDLRYVLIASISAKQGLAIRHKAFFVENRGPGVVEVKPRGVLARRLGSGGSLVDDARQEVLINVVEGDSADLILQPVCGGTDGLSPDVITYFEFMNEYGYYRQRPLKRPIPRSHPMWESLERRACALRDNLAKRDDSKAIGTQKFPNYRKRHRFREDICRLPRDRRRGYLGIKLIDASGSGKS